MEGAFLPLMSIVVDIHEKNELRGFIYSSLLSHAFDLSGIRNKSVLAVCLDIVKGELRSFPMGPLTNFLAKIIVKQWGEARLKKWGYAKLLKIWKGFSSRP